MPTTLTASLFLLGIAAFGEGRAAGKAAGGDFPPGDPIALTRGLADAEKSGGLLVLLLVASDAPAARETWKDIAGALQAPAAAGLIRPFPKLRIAADRHPAIAERFGKDRFPVTLFVAPNGKPIGAIPGCPPPAELARRLAEIIRLAEDAGLASGPAREPRETPRTRLPALLARARLTWENGDRLRAASQFEEVLQQAADAPDRPERRQAVAVAHFYLAEQTRKAGDAPSAEEHYRKSLEGLEKPEAAPADATGAAAAAELEKVMRISLESIRGKAALGLSYALRSQERLQEAIEVIEASCRRSPAAMDGQVALYLGILHREIGDREAARKFFKKSRELEPRSVYGLRAARFLRNPDLRGQEAAGEEEE